MPPQLVKTAVKECAIESVVVYSDRAEVKRAIPVSLAAGENEVVVQNLAECVDTNSIRFVVKCAYLNLEWELQTTDHSVLGRGFKSSVF